MRLVPRQCRAKETNRVFTTYILSAADGGRCFSRLLFTSESSDFYCFPGWISGVSAVELWCCPFSQVYTFQKGQVKAANKRYDSALGNAAAWRLGATLPPVMRACGLWWVDFRKVIVRSRGICGLASSSCVCFVLGTLVCRM